MSVCVLPNLLNVLPARFGAPASEARGRQRRDAIEREGAALIAAIEQLLAQ
jgi:hypothetical protein